MKKKKKDKKNRIEEKNILNDIEEPQKNEIQKKDKGIVEKFKLYKFILKIFAFALLVTFGILILVYKQQAVFAIILITALAAILAALIRIIPLIRTLNTKQAKIISMIEILLHLLVGLYLVFAAFNYVNAEPNEEGNMTGFARFNEVAYPYFLAFLLYTRAVSYFWVTVLHRENTDKFKFWVHIITITLAVVIAGLGEKLGVREIALAIAILAFICALVIAGEAGTGYFRYRKAIAEPKNKEKKDSKKEEIEAPGNNEGIDITDIDPNSIPLNDETNQDNIIS